MNSKSDQLSILNSSVGPLYDPPYDSPIEDQFAYNVVKYLKKEVIFIPQYEVRTFCATYRLDFFLSCENTTIGIECDGSKYHDRHKDLIRDVLILGSGTVDTIFRINGRNIYYNLNDCLWLISYFRPQVFSTRGLTNIEVLASHTAKSHENISSPFVVISHDPEDNDDYEDHPWEIFLEIRSLSPTNYYYYMFKDFWDIIKYRKLFSVKKIEEYFNDIPALIDTHFKWLNSLSSEEYLKYKQELQNVQMTLYPVK
jgi:hypothetical protein